MKTLFVVLIGMTMVALAHADEPAAKRAPKGEMKSLREKASYSIGLNIGRSMKQQGVDLDVDRLTAGIADGIAAAEPKLTDEEIQEVMKEFEEEVVANHAVKVKASAEKNKKEGETFLSANKKKAGVVTTKSGLQYKVLKEGKGQKPKKTDTVTTHYVGTLLDGSEFDSSVKRGEPATFAVNGVIPGWTEALQLMPVGSKWRIYVPADLAYRAEGAGPKIGPNATLVFDVELLKIGKAEEAALPAEDAPEK